MASRPGSLRRAGLRLQCLHGVGGRRGCRRASQWAADPGHEELYFVHRGRARFSLDGEEFEAGPGTYVFVRDPAVHRHAVALEAGTTVLSFGGPPTFEPSAWEWSFRAGQRDELRSDMRDDPLLAALRDEL